MGGRKHAPPLFYGTYKPLGVITAALTGLQHALAMAAGLVTPPLLIGQLSPDPATRTCEWVTYSWVLFGLLSHPSDVSGWVA